MQIKLQSTIVNDKYTEFLYDKYDIQNREVVTTDIPTFDLNEIKDDWNILLILGNSGSGKSTILKSFGTLKEPQYDYNKSLISQFPNLTEEEASDLFLSCGLSSIPTLLKKPSELSNGERARLDICWFINQTLLDGEIILLDEFTSVVNREVAKSLSFALQRYLRKHNHKAIIASCHFDLTEWLQPDYIFNLNKQDKEGNSELEHLVYNETTSYTAYNSIKNNDILSEEREVVNENNNN